MKAAMVVLALATSAFALPAAAQLNMSSVYVGGSLGRSDYKVPDETDTAWRLFGGYQLNRNFAAEIGYHNLGTVNFTGGTIGGYPIQSDALTISGQFTGNTASATWKEQLHFTIDNTYPIDCTSGDQTWTATRTG